MAEFPKNGWFARDSNRYGTFVGAASVTIGGATVSVNARSGLSRYVRVRWDFGDKTSKHVLCGTDALLPKSSRIFAGA